MRDMNAMAIDGSSQVIALIIQGAIMGLLALIAALVRRAYFTIRDSLQRLENVQERIGSLEERDAKRESEYATIRDELFYLKGVVGVPIDAAVSAAIKEMKP